MGNIKVTVVRTADAPTGPVCTNWGYRTWMPPEFNFSCESLRDESFTVSDSEMGGWGSGTSRIRSFRCALFDASLAHENGVGPLKCSECKLQSGSEPLDMPATPSSMEGERDGR